MRGERVFEQGQFPFRPIDGLWIEKYYIQYGHVRDNIYAVSVAHQQGLVKVSLCKSEETAKEVIRRYMVLYHIDNEDLEARFINTPSPEGVYRVYTPATGSYRPTTGRLNPILPADKLEKPYTAEKYLRLSDFQKFLFKPFFHSPDIEPEDVKPEEFSTLGEALERRFQLWRQYYHIKPFQDSFGDAYVAGAIYGIADGKIYRSFGSGWTEVPAEELMR